MLYRTLEPGGPEDLTASIRSTVKSCGRFNDPLIEGFEGGKSDTPRKDPNE